MSDIYLCVFVKRSSDFGFLQLLVVLEQLLRADCLEVVPFHVDSSAVLELDLADFLVLPVETPNYSLDRLFGYLADYFEPVDVGLLLG